MCPWHAPFFVGPLQNEPSLHRPVVPAGALDGACAIAVVASSRAPINDANAAAVFIIILPVYCDGHSLALNIERCWGICRCRNFRM